MKFRACQAALYIFPGWFGTSRISCGFRFYISCRGGERNFIQLVFSGDNTGRLLKYKPNTKEPTVLVRNLQFPNGVPGARTSRSSSSVKDPSAGGDTGGKENRRGLLRYLPFYLDFQIIKLLLKYPFIAKIQFLLNIGGRLHGVLVNANIGGQ
ncbi:hypothetical protein C5167_011856 [Papaver somniferum]|uniref:Strictosidine synthase conserved region domain-containing protein n=1 Tax=Papaver somniferum TaxID=3469 RepID=A0A4Y7IYX9_PAPSO|nr:hypothetical protein C5167_011856 [Papaver somniferum]